MQKQLLLLLLASLSITAQGQDLYNLTTIETTFAKSNRDQILDQDYNNGDYILAQSITNPLSESDGIDKFSPQRAEHEPYGIAAGTTSFLAGDLVINEFMASNDTTQADQDGDFDDWIELYNNTSASISLDGFYLSDDTDNLTKWAFPDGTSIGGNGYLIIWADQDVDQNGLHADFKLSAGGESVVLVDAGLAIVDSITYLDQESDISHGRFPNGTGDFQDMRPTFNAENTDELPDTTDPELTTSPLAGDLVVNEFMASNDATQADQDGEFEDWIELYNNTSASISLDGFYLTDDLGNLTKWAFPDGTSIAGNGYLMIWADEDTDQDGLHADFKLSAGGETLVLVDADIFLIDTITYVDQEADISHGRFPNGTGEFKDMTPTFNAENSNGIVSTRYQPLTGTELTLFPNPTAGMINVRLEQAYADDLQFYLYATDGRLLRKVSLTRGSTTLEIDATDLPDGFYFLSVADELAVDAYKVVIRK
ncbi:MAG: lamin tail domain-containing protein [Lewinella sp.]|nr:lamin tail domain-containing protein [Lewinella sp.]